MMSDLDRARSADYFALGCIIAEIYSRVPLFSQRSITEYLLAYVDYTAPSSPKCGSTGDEWIADVTVSILGIQPTESRSSSASETLPWDASVRQRLSKLPQNIKVRTHTLSFVVSITNWPCVLIVSVRLARGVGVDSSASSRKNYVAWRT